MAKLFLFAIGGTGSRVVKALTLLLASGVDLPRTDTLVPIIVDPDSANGDLTRTVDILKLYKELREKAYSPDSGFFKTRIASLDGLSAGSDVYNNFKFDIDGVKEQQFKQFIGFSELDRNNRAFASLLFSKSNLDADMEVGFKGNPNIGSVVLNKFKESEFFLKFASNFEQDDRVFIVSSIFGGTGAAGFPLILKNIRNAGSSLPHHHFLKNARIGAVTLLPYFGVTKNEHTTIDSNTFVSKTKAALHYYAANVTGNQSINALYYIGDKVTNDQEGADGAGEQKNRAHFVELAAALSIVDFMHLPDTELPISDGKALDPKYFEFGLKEESTSIRFADLAASTHGVIAGPMTQYVLFKSFMDHHYDQYAAARGEAWATNGKHTLTKEALGERFLGTLKKFNRHFADWLAEMSRSNVAFDPLDDNRSGKDIYHLVNGAPHRKGFFKRMMEADGLDNYLTRLSKGEPGVDHLPSDQKLSALFYKTTKAITEDEGLIK